MSGDRGHLLGAEGSLGGTCNQEQFFQPLFLTSLPSSGPRGGAVPRKPVSEMPMERDRGAAHSQEPGKDSIPGRNQEPGTASSALRPQLPCLHPLPPSLSRFGGSDTGKRRREDGRAGGKWKPNEEKTQLELISQVTASIRAVREGWGGYMAGSWRPDTWILIWAWGRECGYLRVLGTTGEAYGDPQGWVCPISRWFLQPLPLFPPSPLPCQVTPTAMQPPGVLKAPCPLPACPRWLGQQGGWRCSCWAWQGLGVPCVGGDGGPSLRRVATLVLAPLGEEGLWAWVVEGGWDLGRLSLGS